MTVPESEGPSQIETVAVDPDSSLADADFSQSLSFTFAVDDDQSLLSTHLTNNEEENFVPREIIATKLSSTGLLQAESRRPLLAGTYNDIPAYLLRLQFQFQAGLDGRSWFSRIQSATITVVFEDAPGDSTGTSQSRSRSRASREVQDLNAPSIVKTFPGDDGWEGAVSTMPVSTESGVGFEASCAGINANAHWNQTKSRDTTGKATVNTLRQGKRRNRLIVTVTENPIDANGIPSYMVLPLIVTHLARRFSMRVTVRTTFGVWRGKLSTMVPVLGRADEPLMFDPNIISEKMDACEKGIGGVGIVEWVGPLEDLDLQQHSSLRGNFSAKQN